MNFYLETSECFMFIEQYSLTCPSQSLCHLQTSPGSSGPCEHVTPSEEKNWGGKIGELVPHICTMNIYF
jgi:hypothetical protein